MSKKIKAAIYVLTILLLIYVTLSSGFDVLWHSLGGTILYYHKQLPMTDDYTGEATIIPAIILFIYVFSSSIYFITIGWKKLKIYNDKKKIN